MSHAPSNIFKKVAVLTILVIAIAAQHIRQPLATPTQMFTVPQAPTIDFSAILHCLTVDANS